MLKKNNDLHGSAPDECSTAILIIDVINDFDFEDGQKLFDNAMPVAQNIKELKLEARKRKIPVIYVNDNFGKWKSNINILVDHCINDNTLGKSIAELLRPENEDYFVLKAKHSGFYSTTLSLLLEYLNTETLILTGITTDICIFFTANDAYMRDFKIIVPSDCTAAVYKEQHIQALDNMKRIVKAEIVEWKDIDLARL
ncbi:MAG TPA: isochorismatase family cysteine hydrolase [Cytophagaceae bacterium]|jgi:nicotinamidase-related amidase